MFDAELDTAPFAPVAAPPIAPQAPESLLASPAPEIAPDVPPVEAGCFSNSLGFFLDLL